MKYFIRFKLRNLTVAGLALIMAATFAVPFFAYPDQLMADTQDDLDAVVVRKERREECAEGSREEEQQNQIEFFID